MNRIRALVLSQCMLSGLIITGCGAENPGPTDPSSSASSASSLASSSSSSVVVSSSSSLVSSSSSSPMSSSSSSAPPIDYPVPDNDFAVNGGVEDGLTRWGTNAASATVERATAVRRSGSASARITGRTASWHGITVNVGHLTEENEYEVAVWVRLASGSAPADIMLTAKRQDDADPDTYNEFEMVATASASADNWTLLRGFYIHRGTPFEHFLIESSHDSVSYYVDDFSIGGEVSPEQSCALPTRFEWESTPPLISAKNGAYGIKDPSIVHYDGRFHIWATINDGDWKSVYLNFTDWDQADNAQQIAMHGTRVGNTVAPQIFYYRPHNLWYNFTQWGRGYSTTNDISNVNSWSARRDFLRNGPPIESDKPELDYWVICDDTHCHLFFSRDDGVLYKSKTTRANFPNFDGYEVVMSDHRGDGRSFLFEAANVYKVDGSDQYLLLVEAYRTPGYGPRYFRSWTSTSLDGPWQPLADTEENPFAGESNVVWPQGKWTTGISHGELVRSGHDEYLTIDPCNLEFLYQGDSGPTLDGGYGGIPYKLGLLRLRR